MNSSTRGKFWTVAFMVLLALHALGCFALGAAALIDWAQMVNVGFGVTYRADLDIIGVIIGLELFFLGGISALSLFWVRGRLMHGTVTGIAVGLYMLVFGIVAYLMTRQTGGLMVDSTRGLLTVIVGFMARRELASAASLSPAGVSG